MLSISRQISKSRPGVPLGRIPLKNSEKLRRFFQIPPTSGDTPNHSVPQEPSVPFGHFNHCSHNICGAVLHTAAKTHFSQKIF